MTQRVSLEREAERGVEKVRQDQEEQGLVRSAKRPAICSVSEGACDGALSGE